MKAAKYKEMLIGYFNLVDYMEEKLATERVYFFPGMVLLERAEFEYTMVKDLFTQATREIKELKKNQYSYTSKSKDKLTQDQWYKLEFMEERVKKYRKFLTKEYALKVVGMRIDSPYFLDTFKGIRYLGEEC